VFTDELLSLSLLGFGPRFWSVNASASPEPSASIGRAACMVRWLLLRDQHRGLASCLPGQRLRSSSTEVDATSQGIVGENRANSSNDVASSLIGPCSHLACLNLLKPGHSAKRITRFAALSSRQTLILKISDNPTRGLHMTA
jgi:hypothetical protein